MDGRDGALPDDADALDQRLPREAAAVLCELQQVEAGVGGAAAKGRRVQAAVRLHVDLGDVDEAAEAGHAVPGGLEQRPGQGVEHHVDALATGRLHDGRGEAGVPAGEDVVRVEAEVLHQEIPLGPGAAGRVDLGAKVLGQVDSRLAGPPRRGVDQDALAPLEVGELHQAAVGRHVRRGEGGGVLPRDGHVVGQLRHRGPPRAAPARQAAPDQREDAVADLEPAFFGSRAQGGDDPGGLVPLEGLVELPQRDHDIAEVEAERLGLDLYHPPGDVGRAELNVVDEVGVDCDKCQLENSRPYNRLEQCVSLTTACRIGKTKGVKFGHLLPVAPDFGVSQIRGRPG